MTLNLGRHVFLNVAIINLKLSLEGSIVSHVYVVLPALHIHYTLLHSSLTWSYILFSTYIHFLDCIIGLFLVSE